MFIAVDLKVIEGLAAAVGRAGAMSEDAVLAGLVRLWHRCWADEIDTLTGDEISGLFAFDAARADGSARAIGALVAFGFLETLPEMTWRVKGAERYLRLKESRRRGAALTNARIAKRRRSKSGALERTGAYAQERSLTESPSHRVTESPNTNTSPPARSRVLSDRLVATFLEKRKTPYKFASTIDGPALARLLKACDSDDEIDRRWRIGLDGKFRQEANTIAQLDSKWNDLTKSEGPAARPEPNYTEGPTRI